MKRADLQPPLGFPGGPCHVVQRIREEVRDPKVQNALIEDVETGETLTNAEAAQVYDLEVERGPANTRFKQMALTAHVQYRMDQRGITVTELRMALAAFQQRWAVLKSQGRSQVMDQQMARGEKILWVDPRIRLALVFTVQRDAAHIITAYWDGQSDPKPGTCHVAYRSAPEPGVKTLVSPKSEKNLPTDVDREKERALPPDAATPNAPSSGGDPKQDRSIGRFEMNKPDNDIPDRPRTLPQPGEEHGVPVKEDYGYVTRRSMKASIDRIVEAYARSWRPGQRQRRQRGPDKQKAREYYRRNRNKIRAKARMRYQRSRRNPQFQRAQKHRRSYPHMHRRLAASVVVDLFLASAATPLPVVVATAFLNAGYGQGIHPPSRIPPAKRQTRQQGPDKMESRREYRRNKPQKIRTMKRRHRVLMRNQQYRRYKKWYNDNYREHGEKRFRRVAEDLPGIPEIGFVFGPEMATGVVRSLSETGMVTFLVEDYSEVLTMPFLAFVESVVFLSESDINAFFAWADQEIGPEAYGEVDENIVRECAGLFDVDPDSDEFRDRCLDLLGEDDFEAMSPEQLEAVNEVLITKRAEGVTFTWEREAPNNEINSPGPDVGYAPSSPSHWKSKPDEKESLPKGESGPNKHEDNLPPASSRVVPTGLRDTGGESTYARAASRVATRWAAKISDIQSRADALSRQRATKVGPVRTVRSDPSTGLWVFQVTGSKGNKVYTVKMKGLRKGNTLDVSKLDVRVSCSCPAFRWQGPEHWAKVEYYQQGRPQGTASFPHVRDPHHNHPACKHVLAVFRHMPKLFLDPVE